MNLNVVSNKSNKCETYVRKRALTSRNTIFFINIETNEVENYKWSKTCVKLCSINIEGDTIVAKKPVQDLTDMSLYTEFEENL